MKIRNINRLPVIPVIVITFLNLCCSSQNKLGDNGNTQPGLINASVTATCGTTINYSGTQVFAYKVNSGSFAGMLLVGGYTNGETKEMGFYLPWPPAVTTHSMSGLSSGYYDPVNSPNDAQNSSDQYGTAGGGNVVIENFTIGLDNTTINSIKVTLNNITIRNIAGDNLCINNGVIQF